MDIRQYYNNFLTLLSGNTLSQLIPFIVAPIISRIYSPEEIGTFSNFFAIVSLIGIIAAGRFEIAIPIVKSKLTAQNLVFSGLVFTIILTLLSFIFPFYASNIANFYKDEAIGGLLWLMPIAVFCYGVMLILVNWFLRLKQYKIISFNKIALALINNGATVALGFFKVGSIGLALGWLISQVVAMVILLFRVDTKMERSKKDFNSKVFKATLSEFRDFPMINALHAFMDVFATQFLLFWIITITFGSYEFGIYALMFKYIRGPIGLVTHSLSQLFYVETSEAMNNKLPIKHLIIRTIKITAVFATFFSIVLLLFGQKLFTLYFGSEWTAGGVYAQCILPVLFFTFIVSPISGLTILFRKQFIGFILSLCCYLFSILAFVIGIQFDLSFEQSLLIYSSVYSCYFIAVLLWYKHLVNQYEQSI